MLNERLIIFTHVLHYRLNDKILAHGPYVNEINMLAEHFREVVVVAPFVKQTQNISAGNFPYSKTPRLINLPVAGGDRLVKKLSYLWHGPMLIFQLSKSILMRGTLHPRAPGSIALLTLILITLIGRGKKKFAKFAGEWDTPKSMPLTFRWQQRWLSNCWLFNGPVFVYTQNSNAPHIIPSFTSNLTKSDIAKANALALPKELESQLIIVFAGRLSKNKGVDVLIEALGEVNKTFSEWKLLIMGDGVEIVNLKKQAQQLGIENQIEWLGWCSQESMMNHMVHAHIVCQPTRFTESWGKVLQEGMAFGCVPIASAVGGLKRQLSDRPELLFEPGNANECAAIISNFITRKINYSELKQWSIKQSNLYSLNALADFTYTKTDEYYASK